MLLIKWYLEEFPKLAGEVQQRIFSGLVNKEGVPGDTVVFGSEE